MNTLKLFFGVPLNKVVYCVKNNSALFNASTLESISDSSRIQNIIPIEGALLSKYGTHPFVVCTEKETYHIMYTKNGKLYMSDGQSPSVGRIESFVDICIPDIQNFNGKILNPVLLDNPDINVIIEYNNSVGSQTPIFAKQQHSPAPQFIAPPSPIFDHLHTEAPNTGTIVELSEIRSKCEELDRKVGENGDVRKDIDQIFDILDALIRRVYSLYPVKRKTDIRSGKILYQEMTVPEYMKLVQDNKLKNKDFPALFQPYAGSHRSENRIMTVTDTSDKNYYVVCNFDVKTNKLTEPKFN